MFVDARKRVYYTFSTMETPLTITLFISIYWNILRIKPKIPYRGGFFYNFIKLSEWQYIFCNCSGSTSKFENVYKMTGSEENLESNIDLLPPALYIIPLHLYQFAFYLFNYVFCGLSEYTYKWIVKHVPLETRLLCRFDCFVGTFWFGWHNCGEVSLYSYNLFLY